MNILKRLVLLVLTALSLFLLSPVVASAQIGSNQIATVAAGMAAGTWHEVLMDNTNVFNTIQCGGDCVITHAGTGNIIGDANFMAWDWKRGVMHFTGAEHQGTSHYVTYTAADNTWHAICGNDVLGTDTGNPAYNPCHIVGGSHGYRFSSVDPVTGTYYLQTQGNGNSLLGINQFRIGDSIFSLASSIPGIAYGFSPTVWWEGPLANGDANGTWVSIDTEIDPAYAFFWTKTTNTWNQTTYAGAGATNSYNSFAVYSRILNVTVFGRGRIQPRQLFMLDKNKTLTRLDDSPVDLGDRYANPVADPVSGKIIVMGGGNCGVAKFAYVLDPIASPGSQWAALTGGNVPPSAVGDPMDELCALADGVVSFSDPNDGVMGWLTCRGGNIGQCNMYLHKYADSGFPARSTASGVVRAFGFETSAEFNHFDQAGGGNFYNYGITPINTTTDYSLVTQGTDFAADGVDSLKFTIPGTISQDVGSWYANYSANLATTFGASSDFYMQWRQRFSPEFLTNNWSGGEGFKQLINSLGDPNTSTFSSSCQTIEIPVQNQNNRNLPESYNACPGTGSTSHPATVPFETQLPGGDIQFQNFRPDPGCLYSQYHIDTGGPPFPHLFPPLGNCFGYSPNEWMTFQIGVHVGPRGTQPALGQTGSTNLTYSSGLLSGHSILSGTISGLAANKSDCSLPTLPSCEIVYWPGSGTALAHTTSNATATAGSNIVVCYLTTDGASNTTSKTNVANYVGNDEFGGSYYDMWMARENQPAEWTLHFGPFAISADTPAANQTFGKIWLLPYDTGRSAVGYPVAYTWYDDLIISTKRIPDPLTFNAGTTSSLSLSKSGPSSVSTSTAMTYTIGLGNRGGTISGIVATVADQLPPGVIASACTAGTGITSVSCTNLGVSGGLVVATVGLTSGLAASAPNGTASFTITATSPSGAATITNYASIDPTGSASPPTPGTSCTSPNCANVVTTVGNVGPAVIITSPLTNAKVQGFLQATTAVTPNGAPIATVQYRIDGSIVGNAFVVSPYPLIYNLQPITPGSHTLLSQACDTLARCSTASINIVVVPRGNILKKIFKKPPQNE